MLNPLEFQRYIQASAKRANLSVVWRDDVPPHANDQGQIVLPTLLADASEDDYRRQLHIATHEASHVLYTDFTPFKTVNAMRSFLGHIFNGVEDARIEYLNAQEYEGDRSNSDRIYPTMLDPLFKKLRKMPPEKRAELDKMLASLWFLVKAQAEYYASGNLLLDNLEKMMSKESLAYTEKMKAGDYLDVMRTVRANPDPVPGTNGALELAKRIYEEVFGEDADKEIERLEEEEKERERQKRGEKGEEEGEGGGGGGEEDSDDSDEGADGSDGDGDDGEEGDKTGKGGDSRKKDSKLPSVKYQEWLPNQHEMVPTNERTSMRGHHVEYAGYIGSEKYKPATKDEYVVVDFCKKKFDDTKAARGGASALGYEDMVRHLPARNGAAFAAQVRTRLQIRAKDRYEHGVKKGKLQTSLLHRVTIPNAQSLNERVFKRRIVNDTLDTAVVWLGDGSGSMGGNKYTQLIHASMQFNEAVGNVIGIPIEIHSFSTWYKDGTFTDEKPLMYVHRDFATRKLGNDELLRRMAIGGAHLANNPDGDSIMWSYDRLRASRAKRKLLIVASDGSPACYRGGDIDWYTRKVVKEIETETPIQIVGIGIMDSNVRRIYKEHYVINDASELEQALLSLIDKKIR